MPHFHFPACATGGDLPASVWTPASVADLLIRAREIDGGITFCRADGSERVTSFADLYDHAIRLMRGLRARGRTCGDYVVFQLAEAEDLIPALWACVLAGITPVVLPPAAPDADSAPATRRLAEVCRALASPPVVTTASTADRLAAACSSHDQLAFWHVDDLSPMDADARCVPGHSDAVAVVMGTSGSSDAPKLVALTHANVIASVAASAFINQYTAADISLNWLPLYHVGALMRSIREVYLGCTQIQIDTAYVRRDPVRWMDLIARYRATLSWGPNTAFALVAERRRAIVGGSPTALACVRSLYSSGEPVLAVTIRRFVEAMAPFGLRSDSLHTAWGMTEACFATCSHTLVDAGQSGDAFAVDAGGPVPGIDLRVVGECDAPLAEGDVGHIQIAGPLVCRYVQPEHNRDLFTTDGWLRTGDLGMIRWGRVCITGRSKEVVKVGGIAYANAAIEAAASEVAGIDRAAIVACAVSPAAGEPEALAIFFATTADDTHAATDLVHAVRAAVVHQSSVTPRFVVPLARDELPRTGIGKIQRGRLCNALLAGAFACWRLWPYDLRATPEPGATVSAASRAERELAGRIAALLGDVLAAPMDHDDNVFASGATSLHVVEAVMRLSSALPVAPSIADLFHAPTPRALSARLLRRTSGTAARSPVGAMAHAARVRRRSDARARSRRTRIGS